MSFPIFAVCRFLLAYGIYFSPWKGSLRPFWPLVFPLDRLMSAFSGATGTSIPELWQFVQRRAKPGQKWVDSKQTETLKPFLVKGNFSCQLFYISPKVNKTEQGYLRVDFSFQPQTRIQFSSAHPNRRNEPQQQVLSATLLPPTRFHY